SHHIEVLSPCPMPILPSLSMTDLYIEIILLRCLRHSSSVTYVCMLPSHRSLVALSYAHSSKSLYDCLVH
ncbi:hypothetical protein, partial [Falsiporphyromonas endometrii]